jgi:hypothetical protein
MKRYDRHGRELVTRRRRPVNPRRAEAFYAAAGLAGFAWSASPAMAGDTAATFVFLLSLAVMVPAFRGVTR